MNIVSQLQSRTRIIHGAYAGLLLAVLIPVLITTPQKIGPVGVVGWFIALYLLISLVLFKVLKAIFKQKSLSTNLKSAFAIAFIPVVLLGLYSIGQLQPQDVILLIILFALVTMYVHKMQDSQ